MSIQRTLGLDQDFLSAHFAQTVRKDGS